MKTLSSLIVAGLWLNCVGLLAQEQTATREESPKGKSWSKTLEDRSKRGTLHDAFQRVRGDTGKWNDDPILQLAPSVARKPPKLSLDDWADQLLESGQVNPTSNEEVSLLFKTRQLDDNDRVWVERIDRKGNQITVVLREAIWQGKYSKTFTYYNVYGVNLGKLEPGKYKATWIVKPLQFRTFEGTGRPTDQQKENWPKDELPADKKAAELSVEFTVEPERTPQRQQQIDR